MGPHHQQAAWTPAELAAAATTWKIGYGHHPVLSNGRHGNANDNFAPFADTGIRGQMDVFLAGHDHNLQWLETDCPGTEYLVSGGGGNWPYPLDGDNPSHFEEETNGFLWVEIDGRTFTGVFYDADGKELYRRSYTKWKGVAKTPACPGLVAAAGPPRRDLVPRPLKARHPVKARPN